MTADKLLLLQEELSNLEKAAEHLRHSLDRTRNLFPVKNFQSDELERMEALASRFARLCDLLMQRVMRLVDDLELTPTNTLLDRIQRAEKRGWVDDAMQLVQIRELRNLIAHEYAADKMDEIYTAVASLAPTLLAAIPKVMAYARELGKKYPVRRT